ncbi:hypothetical protein CR513_01108, partial [Mucuna pruriens]
MAFFDACHINNGTWRPQVTTLRVSKDLKKLPMEEILCTLKVHEIELNKDEGQRKGKSIVVEA